jgi:formylglycine-generating enzyme required for sulfatase activity
MKSIQCTSLLLLAVLSCAPANGAITIPTVPVGDAGNPNDPTTGFGGVSYAYNIGTTEVTVGQYTAFLNAVAATDTYSLYNPSMASDLHVAGIARSGSPGSYAYSVIGSANHPVTYVSWGDATRFANWLSKGQPTGAEGPGTTETGAYTLNGAMTDSALMAVTRNAGAKWFIPTENEWYKAAYYQPAAAGGDSDGYWLYPMKTNSVPYSDQPPGATPDNTHVGNLYNDDGIANGYNDGYAVTGSTSLSSGQNYLTDVGAYTSAAAYYGTFDQGGNVNEWNETAVDSSDRGLRGGSWAYTPVLSFIQASFRYSINPSFDSYNFGFRVVSLPEPGSMTLCFVGLIVLVSGRGRK